MRLRLFLILALQTQLLSAAENRVPVNKLLEQMIHRSTLAEPGGKPFYVKATITDKDDAKSQFNGTVEEYWVSPTKWRRVVKLRDFSQTKVVNGEAVFEENSGDFFPVVDELLANEIVDPLPQPAVDLMNSLGMAGDEPGSRQGQCMSEKYFNDADGRETRVLLAYDCRTGLLIYLWSPTCCYGVMTDYKKFHNKMVAYATKDDPVNFRIDTLRDLDVPDESLFAVAQPTPPEKQMTTTRLSETQARALVVEKSDVQWPAVSKKPTVESVRVELLIGRDGRVKEAKTYSPIENAIEDATLTAVRKWTFQPQSLNGVPAQVRTELIISFPASYLAPAAGQPDVKSMFEKVRAVNSLRSEGAAAFHLRASFHTENGDAKGTYEETWVSPTKWRRELKLNGVSLVEVRTEQAFYRAFPGKYAPRLADDLIDSLAFSLPGDNGVDFHTADWNVTNAKLGELPLLRLSNGYISPQGRPDAMTVMYFAAEESNLIRGRFHYSELTVFNDFQAFGKKLAAHKLTLFSAESGKIEINIDTLEPASNPSDELFHMSGVAPVYTSEEQSLRFTQPLPIYIVKPSVPGYHGTLTCGVKVDEHGHVREVEVKNSTDEAFVKPIRDALMKWEYQPATINGHPSVGFFQVKVQ